MSLGGILCELLEDSMSAKGISGIWKGLNELWLPWCALEKMVSSAVLEEL